MQTYRIEVRGVEEGQTAAFEYSVHGWPVDGSLNLRFSGNYVHGYSLGDTAVIIEWLSSRKWLSVKEIKLIPFVH